MTTEPKYDADICIIGTGAAGLTLAAAMLNDAAKILLLEGGAAGPSVEPDDMLDGETAGFPFTGLTAGRARTFGGATTLWFGQCIRLDEIDLASRGWVPDGGWPLSPADLESHYVDAERMIGIPAPLYDARLWEDFGVAAPDFDCGDLKAKFTIYIRQPDLGRLFGPALRKAPNVEIRTGATVTRLNVTPDAARVVSAEIRGMDGTVSQIRARTFVLCGGGIENPRLLLASRDIAAAGLGNGYDQVGRYLQDHPSGRTAEIRTDDVARLQEIFAHRRRGDLRYWPKLALSEAAQRRHETLNSNGYVVYDYGPGSSAEAMKSLLGRNADARRSSRSSLLSAILKDTPRLAGDLPRAVRGRRMPLFPPERLWLQAFSEQAPEPRNRVMLGQGRDRHGVPVARVEWRLGDAEHRTLSVFTEAVGAEFERLGLGKLRLQDWMKKGAADLSGHVNDAYHHAGTTRMSDDPRHGVVDPNCRVHGVANLFVAGSSVFPTSGYANPTLTIMALAMRLAGHLKTWPNRPV